MSPDPTSAASAASRAEAEIDKLMALHPAGFDLSLDRIRALLKTLGDPQDRLPPVIHIAGTNGKGSVAAFARALLEATGRTVNIHTSPAGGARRRISGAGRSFGQNGPARGKGQ